MSSIIAKFILNRLLKDNQWNKIGVENPYYQLVPIEEDSKGNIKYKKIPRAVPDGISVNDLTILESFKRKAYRYDYWFSILGISFGWCNIISLIPIVGTVISTYWSLKLLRLTWRLDYGFPLDLQILFIINIVIDFVLGLIPFVGTIIEIGYKANSRNYLLLEKHLQRVGEEKLGYITKEEIRPGFINDKIQPFVEDKIKPMALKSSEQVLELLHHRGNNNKPRSASSDDSASVYSVPGSTNGVQNKSPCRSTSSTYDHRVWKTGLPVRSAVLKPHAGRLVVGWVTTSESRLLYVF